MMRNNVFSFSSPQENKYQGYGKERNATLLEAGGGLERTAGESRGRGRGWGVGGALVFPQVHLEDRQQGRPGVKHSEGRPACVGLRGEGRAVIRVVVITVAVTSIF